MRSKRLLGLATAALFVAAARDRASAAPVLFWSDQGTPVEEQQAIRDTVLKGFGGEVDFQPQDPGPFVTRIQAEAQAGKGSIGVIGGLHGDFAGFPDAVVGSLGSRRLAVERRRQPDLSRPRQALDERAEIHSVDAGDLHHGRQQEGA